MIIPQIIGGLGNQMFQYAMSRALAIKKDAELKLDISLFKNYQLHQGFQLQKIFNSSFETASKEDLKKILRWQYPSPVKSILTRSSFKYFRSKSFIVEPHFHFWDGIDLASNKAYLIGYWQSEKYFSACAEQIRKDFTFRRPLTNLNLNLYHQILETNSVSLHVRRGDYLSNTSNLNIYSACSLNYYKSAIRRIVEQVPSPHFFIFSDDIAWAKGNLKISHPLTYVDINKAEESYNDMRLMSLCKHNIIANSSFSWWGAWLNSNPKKVVIAPRIWFVNNTDSRDLVPAEWTSL